MSYTAELENSVGSTNSFNLLGRKMVISPQSTDPIEDDLPLGRIQFEVPSLIDEPSNAEVNAETNAEVNVDIDAEANAVTDAEANVESEAEANVEGDAETNAESGAETNAVQRALA